MENGDKNNVSFIRSVLNSEVKFIIGVVLFVVGGIAPYYGIKQDIALIQKDVSTINANHLTHTQDLAQEIKDTVSLMQAQQAQINELQKQNAVILEKLSEKN